MSPLRISAVGAFDSVVQATVQGTVQETVQGAVQGTVQGTVQGAPPGYLPELRALMPKVPRRISRLIQLTLLGAYPCAQAAGGPLAADCAVYLATAQGNSEDTLALLEQVIALDEDAEPYRFINVSPNMAGCYLAQTLGLRGANLTVAERAFSFEAALELACLDVVQGAVPAALVGAVDPAPLAIAPEAPGRRVVPAAGTDSSQWLLLDPACAAPLAELVWVRRADDPAALRSWRDAARPGLRLAFGAGIPAAERDAIAATFPGSTRFDYGTHLPPFGTLAALGIVRFIASATPGALLHVNGDGHGRYCGVLIDAASR